MTPSMWRIWILCLLGTIALTPFTLALTDEEQRILNRLQEQAENAIGQGDPEGAAQTIGKAALLASQVAQDRSRNGKIGDANILASHYRTQEYAYRAIALFRQSGSQPPASSGVCHSLAQGIAQSAQSLKLALSSPPTQESNPTLQKQILEWEEMLQELQKDFGCVK